METSKKIDTTITLVLTEEEAHILAALVQNSQVPLAEEPNDTTQLRQAIFKVCCRPLDIV